VKIAAVAFGSAPMQPKGIFICGSRMSRSFCFNVSLYKLWIVLILLCSTLVTSLPPLCSPAGKWRLNGRDLVNDFRGRILLLSFMPLECATCKTQIEKYETLVERLGGDVRIAVVVPSKVSPTIVRQFAAQYRRIDFRHETDAEAVHKWVGANEHDHLIFDRCSRLSKIIRHPQSEVNEFHDTYNALKRAVTNADCGWCHYDSQENTHTSRYGVTVSPTVEANTPQITAYVVPQTAYDSRLAVVRRTSPRGPAQTNDRMPLQGNNIYSTLSYQQQMERRREQIAQQRQQYAQQIAAHQPTPPTTGSSIAQGQRPYNDQQMQALPMTTMAPLPAADRPRIGSDVRTAERPNYNPPAKRVRTTNGPVVYSNDPHAERYQYSLAGNRGRDAYLQRERQRQQERQRLYEEQQQRVAEARKARLQQQQLIQQQQAAAAALAATPPPDVAATADTAPLYPEGAENTDYYGDDDYSEWTTVIPQVQIPKPTKPLPAWPTRQSNSVSNYGFELPCAGYTDEICFQQYNQMKEEDVHQCCKERITLTDQCSPGKCSNTTQQLCCIQSFLQAKFKCCSDERQAEVTEPGDKFSRCCFELFVSEENECCPKAYALQEWRSIHELCLPNVDVDLSTVKVPTRLPGTSSLTTDFEFSKTDRWRYV
jgi:thiol-disulfide isomerase/thioredoxin